MTLLFAPGFRICLPSVVEAVDEDELEADELFAVLLVFPLLLLQEELFEFELEAVADPLLLGIIMFILSTS